MSQLTNKETTETAAVGTNYGGGISRTMRKGKYIVAWFRGKDKVRMMKNIGAPEQEYEKIMESERTSGTTAVMEAYRNHIIDMLYQMDSEDDNLFLKQVFTIVHRLFLNRKSDKCDKQDRYKSMVYRIINGLSQETVKEIYYFLVGYTGTVE